MAATTKRYSIELVINTQQLQQAGAQADQVQKTVQQGATGVAGALQGCVDRVSRYVLSMQGLRIAWNEAQRAMEDYIRIDSQRAERTKTLTEQAVQWDASLRQAYRNAGGFENPAIIPGLRTKYENMAKFAGLSHPGEAAAGVQFAESDVAGYSETLKGKTGHLTPEQNDWVTARAMKSAHASNMPMEDSMKWLSAVVSSTDWNKLYGKDAGKHALGMWEKGIEGLRHSRSDFQMNIKNLVPYVAEMIRPDRAKGRITEEGEGALEQAIVDTVAAGEYKPAQAETLLRNSAEAIRFLERPGMKKAFRGAGLDYGNLAQNRMRMSKHYEKLKEAGKLPAGMTFEDYARNFGKLNIRATAGLGAQIAASEAGVDDRTRAAMANVDASNVEAKEDAYVAAIPSMQVESAQADANVEAFRAGMPMTPLDELKKKAVALFNIKGYGNSLQETRGSVAQGWLRGAATLGMGGEWKDPEHYPQYMAYHEMVQRLYPGNEITSGPMGGAGSQNIADSMARKFFYATDSERDKMLETTRKEYQSTFGQTAVELLGQLVDEVRNMNRGGVADGAAAANPGGLRH